MNIRIIGANGKNGKYPKKSTIVGKGVVKCSNWMQWETILLRFIQRF